MTWSECVGWSKDASTFERDAGRGGEAISDVKIRVEANATLLQSFLWDSEKFLRHGSVVSCGDPSSWGNAIDGMLWSMSIRHEL